MSLVYILSTCVHHLFKSFNVYRLHTAYNAYVIQAEFETLGRIDKSSNKTANVAQETMVSQSTFGDDDEIESVGSPKINALSSVNRFEYEPTTSRPVLKLSRSDSPISRQQSALSTDISDIQKDAELQLQNQYRSMLNVQGLPIRGTDQKSLLGLFKILCDHISEPVDVKEIKNIQSNGEILTVTFHDKRKRDMIQRSYRPKNLMSNNILKLLPGEIPTSVLIFPKRTCFYKLLCRLADDYVKKKQLHCYQISSHGLDLKFTADSPVIHVRSEHELNRQILQNELKRKNSVVASPSVQVKRTKNN